MSIITRIVPNILNFTKCLNNKILMPSLNCNSITNQVTQDLKPGGLFEITTRTKMRFNFPRPSEVKRIRKHGWVTRMSTKSGRRVIMNRILKGRWIYTH